jgi:hypothetical protein
MSTQIKLLPNYFKKIGLSLFLITIITVVILKTFHFDDLFNKKILGTIVIDLLTIFCCMIIFSRNKIEDEMSFLIRLKEFAGTFIFSVSFFILMNIMDIFTRENPKIFSAAQLILTMCLTHLFFHYLNIWKNNKVK